MAVNQEDVKAAKSILWPDETVEVTAKQRRIGPGGSATSPTSVLATDKRIIILNRASLGIRQDYEVIPYKQVTSVRLEHGVLSSSVFIRVQGYDRDQGLLKNGKEEGEIDGLNNADAKALADFLNKKLDDAASSPEAGETDSGAVGSRYCTQCGNRNPASSKFCSKCGASLGR
ncbi:MAG: PH domain-containing protein [Candidatus Marsarchaeota archaeon]|nr:PH domain-containing protein [Candidatus Marsarchaeota archaeon]